jgi:hypothetical protein
MDLMHDLIDVIAGERLPCTYAFHDPPTLRGTRQQPHLHLLISARQRDAHMRTPGQHFMRYNRAHPERGGAQKDPAFWHKGAVKAWRVTISDVVNMHLERAGSRERVHPDSLQRRGIDRQAEPKLVPSESRAYRETGKVSPRMQEVLTIRAARQATRAQEVANAHDYWDARKVTLGLTADMDLSAQLAAICEAGGQVRDQAPAQRGMEAYAGVEQDERALGDLAEEAVVPAQAEAQVLWRGVQDLADAWQLVPLGRRRIEQGQAAARGIWQDAQDEQRLRDVGSEAADDAWREAVLLWAEELGARALRDVGWEAVQEAREAGHEALAAALRARRLQEHAQAWPSLAHDIEALREEDGGTGRVRVRLWDRERDQGWGF